MAHKKHSRNFELSALTKDRPQTRVPLALNKKKRLEIVLKCDVAGSVEVLTDSIAALKVPDVDIHIIHTGTGPICKSDILMAQTGNRLIFGFNVEVTPKLNQLISDNCIEVRTYKVIYELLGDLKKIANNLIAAEPEEKITGRAKVVATFKSSRKGMIIGCEVLDGLLETGKRFRVITAMGPTYKGRIDSLKIENRTIKTGKPGQKVGLKIANWKDASIGDLVECYDPPRWEKSRTWQPACRIFRS